MTHPSLPPLSLSLSPTSCVQVFEDLQMETDEQTELHTLLSRPHVDKLLSVHDIVRSRSYEAPVPKFDPTWHPQTSYDRHIRGRGKGKGPEYRTIGLHKSANEPLVSCSYTHTHAHTHTCIYIHTYSRRRFHSSYRRTERI